MVCNSTEFVFLIYRILCPIYVLIHDSDQHVKSDHQVPFLDEYLNYKTGHGKTQANTAPIAISLLVDSANKGED
jgi:hypothetical protein